MTRSIRWGVGLALCATWGMACEDGTAVVGGGSDAGVDVPDVKVAVDVVDDLRDAADVTDVTVDAPADGTVDAPADVAPDAPADVAPDAPVRCASAADCVGSADGAACDTATGRCVTCVAAADTCPATEHCNDLTHRCEVGCRSDDGCMRPSGEDGGAPSRTHCVTATHVCAECLSDDQCPIGNLCVGNVCAPGCSATRGCATGQACCGGGCVDAQTNLAHCGGCDRTCAVPNGAPVCLNGTCAVASCTAPFGDCDRAAANGCETDTRRDVAHCGACGNACPAPAHATAACEAGRCGYTCAAGFADCDLDPSNGCEVDLQRDASHCGACATACDPPNATAACTAGRCAVARCDEGFGDCDGNATNGCETSVRTAVTHCGACGSACPERPNAFPGCVAARCVISCVAGYADCDGNAANGCEVDTRADRNHCGACGRACSTAGGSGVCESSVCRVTGCDAGRGDCDGSATNGCEVDLTATLAHCGACGATCPARPHAAATCARGACGITCDAGFADCDLDPSNGCEAALTAAEHCGRCDLVCADATPVCASGACVSGCAAGQQRCAGACVDPQSNPANCGACGNACPTVAASTRVCASGRCGFVCDAGRGDCDANATNGCEATLATDGNNCGACGRACGAGAACRDGACVSVVPTGILAWYRFDEGSGNRVTDSSGHAFHGTHNAVYAPGRVGTALSFDGSTRAVVPYTEGFTWGNANADFTVEYWAYITSPPDGRWRCLTHKGVNDCGAGDRTSAQWLGPSTMQIHPAISTTATCNDYFVGPSLPLNAWTHIADVKQGTTHLLFINGTLVQSSALSPTTGNLGPYYMGWDPWYSGIQGRMDEVRVYTRALSVAEINADILATGGL